MKKNIKIILAFILGGIIFGSIGTVFALTYRASDITYTPSDNTWNVTTVGQAINDLALSKTSDNYSTEAEQVVGTWIDGKPIYQKTFSLRSPSGDNEILNLESLNIQYIIDISGFVIASSVNQIIPVIWSHSGGAMGSIYYITDTKKLRQNIASSTYYNCQEYITLQYTKTTDTATN